MIPWNSAYNRIAQSRDFATLFGRKYSQDDFRYYAYVLTFPSLAPAQLAASAAAPNTGSIAVTRTNLAAPTTNIVPGTASEKLLSFDSGGVILGISASARKLQRVANNGADINFRYAPSRSPGNLDLFALQLTFADTTPITGSNPIGELVSNPNSLIQTTPPIMADALLGSGRDTDTPARELFVTPGLGLLASVRSLVLPDSAPASPSYAPSNLIVHLVFHTMVPGIIKANAA